jgi:hypothetical protein
VSFSKHYDVRADLLKFNSGVLPKVCRHFTGNVTAEPIKVEVAQPELEHVSHVCAQLLVCVIQCGNVVPVVWIGDIALSIAFIELRVLHQNAVPRSVVGNDVDDDFHAASMSF